MTDMTTEKRPWNELTNILTTVTFGENVESIGTYTFDSTVSLKTMRRLHIHAAKALPS